MAYINFYYINDAVYSAEDKTISIFGEMDMSKEVFEMMAEGYLEDFSTYRNQVYRFDLTDRAEFNYCLHWIDKQVGEENKSLTMKEKLKLLNGKKYVTLIDNATIRENYAEYMKTLAKKNKKSQAKK